MLILSAGDVEAVLDLDRLVDVVEQAMIDLSAGAVSMPARVAARVSGRDGMLAAMPAFLPSANALVTKLVSVFPGNRAHPTHQALICCFDPDTGTPAAVMDGSYITATRTAAASALATRLLARPDADVIAVIGAGVQARAHARALSRLIGAATTMRIAGRTRTNLLAMAGELRGSGIQVEIAPSIEDAVRSADIVCLATHPDQPVIRRDWLRPGTHVNSVGYNADGTGEVDTATVRDALVVVESRAAVLAAPPSGAVEIRRAIEDGALTEGGLVELGELATDPGLGRADDGRLTLYKSVGVAVQDAAAAALVLDAAIRQGVGEHVRI
jgi:ornithine cyclodeaminase/alanine dehydrogenase-like protein (mu-crystallin family)